ncbi:MAG: DinB family protein, partial [Chloroflexi bacterium]|nr:DinB family protein [Chloroflexota bacterium]
PGEGDWSIKEVCGHLSDHARFFHQRLFQMIKQEEPRLPAWDQMEEWKKRDPQSVPLSDLLDELVAQRAETVDMLAELVHWNWARQGRHEERGRLSIRQLVDFAIEHDEAHLDQVRALKATAP